MLHISFSLLCLKYIFFSFYRRARFKAKERVRTCKDYVIGREITTVQTRSYFSERNSVSFPESIESEKGWRFDILCMRSPGVKGICADAQLCDSLRCQSLRFVVEARYSTEPIQ